MVSKFCEIWKILWELASGWAKFCEILSHGVRYGMYMYAETISAVEVTKPQLKNLTLMVISLETCETRQSLLVVNFIWNGHLFKIPSMASVQAF